MSFWVELKVYHCKKDGACTCGVLLWANLYMLPETSPYWASPIASSSYGKLPILKPLNNDAQKHSLKFKLKKMIKSPMGPNSEHMCIYIYILSKN